MQQPNRLRSMKFHTIEWNYIEKRIRFYRLQLQSEETSFPALQDIFQDFLLLLQRDVRFSHFYSLFN